MSFAISGVFLPFLVGLPSSQPIEKVSPTASYNHSDVSLPSFEKIGGQQPTINSGPTAGNVLQGQGNTFLSPDALEGLVVNFGLQPSGGNTLDAQQLPVNPYPTTGVDPLQVMSMTANLADNIFSGKYDNLNVLNNLPTVNIGNNALTIRDFGTTPTALDFLTNAASLQKQIVSLIPSASALTGNNPLGFPLIG